MQYNSTRNNNQSILGTQAIIHGLADDGGLYIPKSFPSIPFTKDLLTLSYIELAQRILHTFFDEIAKDTLQSCLHQAYDNKFASNDVTPLTKTKDGYLLELFHGPTCAFKDVALSLLPHLLTTSYQLHKQTDLIAILTATSGDTGKAALEGFKDVENTIIQVFYPIEGVSDTQKRQMQTSLGKNVSVIGVQGNFDDCQRVVKEAYRSVEIQNACTNTILSSANSINIGRLIPQIVYYYYAYIQLVNTQEIRFGDVIDFVVPTGNFGNILAGYYAKQLGLPIEKLVCASNRNHVLTDFIRTGTYSRNRDFYETMSPSMDILISSNLERLLYHLSGQDDAYIRSLYQTFEQEGTFTIREAMYQLLQENFVGYWTDETDCQTTMRTLYENEHILIDPHTAVAYQAMKQYQQENKTHHPCVVLSTASPFKFSKSVLDSLGRPIPLDDYVAMQQLSEYTSYPIPQGLEAAFQLPLRFTTAIDPQDANTAIIHFIKEHQL